MLGKTLDESLAVVVPVYNGAQTLPRLLEAVVATLQPRVARLQIVLVNDCSPDNSHDVILALMEKYPGAITYARLAKNFGEHNAVICGLGLCDCDMAAIIDDDFQNPPEEILKLVEELSRGYDVVYSRYAEKKHSLYRNLGSKFNDAAATYLLKKPRNLYLSSFKVMNRFLIDVVTQYRGPYPYIDGLILRSTRSISSVLCEHLAREEGQSNYNLVRLIRLWLNMSTSFSIVPLRISTIIGLGMSLIGVMLGIFFTLSYLFERHLFPGEVPPGWASTIVTVTVFAGVQLSMLGILGEYVGRLYLSMNGHPQFVIREIRGRIPRAEAADES